MIIADTTVVSEPLRHQPEPAVLDWLEQHSTEIAITAITLGELRYGALRLNPGARQDRLLAAIETMATNAGARVLPYDQHAADAYARFRVARERTGRPVGDADLMIAAICHTHGSPIATRNTRDFIDLGLDTINPWP